MKKSNYLLAFACAITAAAAPASAALLGDAVTIKRVQGGNVFQSTQTNVGAGFEYTDGFFNIDVTDNEIILDVIGNYRIGDVFYTIEGLDFDDKPATPNVITGFFANQIFEGIATPIGQNRATIGADGKVKLDLSQTHGGSSGVMRLTLGAAVPAGVPEPATWALMIGGFGLAGASARRRGARTTVLA